MNIICYWDKGYDMMPMALKRIFASNLKVCATHGMKLNLITDENVDSFINVDPIFYKLKPNHKSDYVRWTYLYENGGVWIDCDVLLQNKIQISDKDLAVFPEIEISQSQYDSMKKRGTDMGEVLKRDNYPELIKCTSEYLKVGCCFLFGKKESAPIKWAKEELDLKISEANSLGVYDSDGTISYDVFQWHVIGPLITVDAIKRFPDRCFIYNEGKEDSNGFNAVTWKVNKDLGFHNENLPGHDKSQWFGEEMKAKAQKMKSNPNFFCIPNWSIYRENDLGKEAEDAIFDNENSLFKYLIK
jgi:hypothetical protein